MLVWTSTSSENLDAAIGTATSTEWGSRVVRKRPRLARCLQRWHWALLQATQFLPQQATPQLCSRPGDSMQEECQKIQLTAGWEWKPSRLTERRDLQRHPKGFWSWCGSLSRSLKGLTVPTSKLNMASTYVWSMEVIINSWYAINWRFKKRNLKQPKNVSCWSPLPRLPGEYTYLIWGGCRGVCGVHLQESSMPAFTVWPTHRGQTISGTCVPRVFWTHTVILTSHGGAPIQRNPIMRKGWDKAWAPQVLFHSV